MSRISMQKFGNLERSLGNMKRIRNKNNRKKSERCCCQILRIYVVAGQSRLPEDLCGHSISSDCENLHSNTILEKEEHQFLFNHSSFYFLRTDAVCTY